MWTILLIIPNLSLRDPVENENVAIVQHDDHRVLAAIKNNPYANALVNNFVDSFGRKHFPSALIIREDAPKHLFDIDAIVGFRNIAAITTVINGNIQALKNIRVSIPTYSDYFNFYPITLAKKNNGFVTQSPSVLGFDSAYKKFVGQISPSLASPGHLMADCSGELFDYLQNAWQRHFVKGHLRKWPARALFRSLEMAYQASSMPYKNHSTIYDYGSSISLWVSAFEILSHPKNGKANLQTVLELLKGYTWLNKDLRRRLYSIKYQRGEKRVNLSQKLYKELYDTRNDFLHGNPVTPLSLRPFKNKNANPITSFAALLYRVALLNHLKQFRTNKLEQRIEKKRIWFNYEERRFNDAFLRVKNTKSQ